MLAAKILVHLIQTTVRIRGKRRVIWLVTSLLDAQQYPAVDIVELHGRLWGIGSLFEQLKIQLSADVFCTATIMREFTKKWQRG
jgi:IS4 transposase